MRDRCPVVDRKIDSIEATEPLEHGAVLRVRGLLVPPVVGRAKLGPEVAQDETLCTA